MIRFLSHQLFYETQENCTSSNQMRWRNISTRKHFCYTGSCNTHPPKILPNLTSRARSNIPTNTMSFLPSQSKCMASANKSEG